MNIKGKHLLALFFTAILLLMMKDSTTYAYVGSIFTYTNEGQTMTYQVLSEPTETENGAVKIIYSEEMNRNLSGEVIIPTTVINRRLLYNVVEVGADAFRGAKDITRISLPDTITVIGANAFYNCSNLTDINIPRGITRIESGTFYGCSNLSGLILPDGITYIGDEAFYNCSALTQVKLPGGLIDIGKEAFYNCKKLTVLNLPNGIESIGSGAFEGCTSLTGITIPSSVTSIEDNLFKNCSSLVSIYLPEGIKTIGKHAFTNCTGLKNIYLPDSITQIGAYAFYHCESLTSIKIPYMVSVIEDFTFLGCKNLTSIRLQDRITKIGNYAFYGCENLISISLPEGVTSIGDWAFYGCEILRPITIPAGVTSIGKGEFPYTGVFVYKNSYAEAFFKANHPQYYQIINLTIEEMIFEEAVKNIGINETLQLKPIFYPEFSSDIIGTIQWTSSNPSVASVDENGKVKGIQAGEADITAVMGKFSATCKIIIEGTSIQPVSIELSSNQIVLNKGETQKLQINFTPADTTNRTVTWKSSNPSVVKVENGRIFAINQGTAVITAETASLSANCTVTVFNPLKEISSNYDKIRLNQGESKRVVISYYPIDTSDDKTILWRSEDEAVATVVDGVITAVKAGTTVITANVGELTHQIPVTVLTPLKSLTVTQEKIALTVGETQALPMVIQPADTTDEIKVTSSDESIVTYSNGAITACKRGNATITIEGGSFTASFKVVVETDITGITLNKQNLKLYMGKKSSLTVAFLPVNAMDDRTVTWTSSDKSVVTVDPDGTIRTKGVGTATITAIAGGDKTASCIIEVKLSIPSSLKTVSSDYNKIKITWGTVSGASGYQIYRAESETGSYKKIKETTATTYTDSGLTTGKKYYYKVRAFRNQGTKKVYSSFTSVMSTTPVPATPTNVKLVKKKTGTIQFTWNKVNGASGYEVYRTSSKDSPYKLTKTTTSLHFINSGLSKKKTYYYKVRAYKIVGKKKIYSKFSTVYTIKF